MKGLQRKCLFGSAIFHGLLLLLVVIGSAFISHKPPQETPAFELFDMRATLVDQPNVLSGGNPNVTAPPQPSPQPPAQAPAAQPPVPDSKPEPAPEPPKADTKPAPKAPPEEKTPEPAKALETKPEPVKNRPPDPDSFDLSKAVKKSSSAKTDKSDKPSTTFDFGKAEKRVIKPSKDGKDSSDGDEKARGDRERQLAQARAGALANAFSNLQGGLSKGGTSYDIPGPGGPAYASYYLALRKFYEMAWIPPNASRGDEPVVEVEVVIARDGTILSQRILKKSGRRELDNSVQTTLNRVYKAKAPRFPDGSTDEKRTFRINFNLTDKLNAG